MTTLFAMGAEVERSRRVYICPQSRVLHTQQLCLVPPASRAQSGVTTLARVTDPDYQAELGLLCIVRAG